MLLEGCIIPDAREQRPEVRRWPRRRTRETTPADLGLVRFQAEHGRDVVRAQTVASQAEIRALVDPHTYILPERGARRDPSGCRSRPLLDRSIARTLSVAAATEEAASGRCLGGAGRGTFASVEPLSRLEIRVVPGESADHPMVVLLVDGMDVLAGDGHRGFGPESLLHKGDPL